MDNFHSFKNTTWTLRMDSQLSVPSTCLLAGNSNPAFLLRAMRLPPCQEPGEACGQGVSEASGHNCRVLCEMQEGPSARGSRTAAGTAPRCPPRLQTRCAMDADSPASDDCWVLWTDVKSRVVRIHSACVVTVVEGM